VPDEPIRKILQGQRQLAQHVESLTLAARFCSPATETIRVLDESLGVRRLMERISCQDQLLRAVAGPIEELRQAGLFNSESPLRREMERASQLLADYEGRFRLPEINEASRLVEQLRASPVAETLKRYAEEASGIQRAIEAMRSPWLNVDDALRSIGGFAELQGIGHALSVMPAFGERLTEALRIDLGDWQDAISWPEPIFTDLIARGDFYLERGFDPALTDFPGPAFRESLDLAGLRCAPPPLVPRYNPPIPRSDDEEEEEGLIRTNTAHDWLQRLESQLRRFIDQAMTTAFGADWARHRLPNGLCEKWQEKKHQAEEHGGSEWPLICYADFTDYELVICKRDNWRELFAPFFGRPESVRESLQRLYPIRICTMHSRPITHDDELLLYVEAQRLWKVIL
jgi:hypothetical protein